MLWLHYRAYLTDKKILQVLGFVWRVVYIDFKIYKLF